jgi:calcium-dependent protein kinase
VGFHEEFSVQARIGKGSTSTVHRVQRVSDGTMMAAKVFLRSFLEAKSQRAEAALNEISLLRAMEHDNILRIHSVYETPSAIYLITDLLEGGNLLERINACKGLSGREVKQVMVGMAEGLSHMHGMGVMHRDIKLENIMFATKDSFEPIIVDLGLAAISEE